MAVQPGSNYWEWLLSRIISGEAEVGPHDGSFGQDFIVPKSVGTNEAGSVHIENTEPETAYALGYVMANIHMENNDG